MVMPNRCDASRDTMIAAETGEAILSHLRKFEYASFKHTIFAILWTAGVPIGSLRAIDLKDYHNGDKQYVEIHHRAESDTPLKNEERGEREIALHEWVAETIDDYIEMHRHDVTDDYGREPLLTSEDGRPVLSTFRRHVWSATRPCFYTNDCPHDKDIPTCEWSTDGDEASKCPSTVSPHDVRRSSITAWLQEGYSKELVSQRMDVSLKVLNKHYDVRTEAEKRRVRKERMDLE